MWPNPQETADLVTCTEEIFNGKLHFFVQWIFPFVLLLFPSFPQVHLMFPPAFQSHFFVLLVFCIIFVTNALSFLLHEAIDRMFPLQFLNLAISSQIYFLRAVFSFFKVMISVSAVRFCFFSSSNFYKVKTNLGVEQSQRSISLMVRATDV